MYLYGHKCRQRRIGCLEIQKEAQVFYGQPLTLNDRQLNNKHIWFIHWIVDAGTQSVICKQSRPNLEQITSEAFETLI